MLSHDRIWTALDALAESRGLSPSALARRAGLDPTAFNKSKRRSADGRPRWPSTESLSKVMDATGATLEDLLQLLGGGASGARSASTSGARTLAVPLVGLAQAGAGGFFDDAGFPAGQGWDEITLPGVDGEAAYAVEVSGDSMRPLYEEGDVLIVSPGVPVRRGDRVVARTRGGEVMVKTLARRTGKVVELASVNPDYAPRLFAPDEIEWLARVVWASQ